MRQTTRTLVLAGCLLGGCTRTSPLPASADLATSADLGGPPDLAPMLADLAACPVPDSPNTTISGRLPDGTFTGRFAWVGDHCDALPILEITESAAPPSPGAPHLTINWQSVPVLGDQPVRVLVVDASGTLDVSGRVTLTQLEPAGSTASVRLAGTLTVNELGGMLALTGDFAAPYCALVDNVCV